MELSSGKSEGAPITVQKDTQPNTHTLTPLLIKKDINSDMQSSGTVKETRELKDTLCKQWRNIPTYCRNVKKISLKPQKKRHKRRSEIDYFVAYGNLLQG